MRQTSTQHGRSGSGPVWLVLIGLVGTMAFFAADGTPAPPTTARISGRVTLEGQPMPAGHSVVFMEPSRGDLAYGVTDADGKFVIDSWKQGEMIPGRYKAYVVPRSIRPEALGGLMDSEEYLILLPADYREDYLHVETTPLEYNVVTGDNRFNIDLQRKPLETSEPASDSADEPAGLQ